MIFKVKDNLRSDPRYKSVKHEDREALFNEYISELKVSEEEAERAAKAKLDEEVLKQAFVLCLVQVILTFLLEYPFNAIRLVESLVMMS